MTFIVSRILDKRTCTDSSSHREELNVLTSQFTMEMLRLRGDELSFQDIFVRWARWSSRHGYATFLPYR